MKISCKKQGLNKFACKILGKTLKIRGGESGVGDNLVKESSLAKEERKINKKEFKEGMRDGIPIGLGYIAVSFALGIAAKEAGLTAFQGFLAAILTTASAGGYAGYTMIEAGGTYLEMALVILIANARYFLMSSALSQKLSSDLPLGHRLFMGTAVTDELFGISFSRRGYLNPYYFYGAMLVTLPFWAIGTSLGIVAGNILSARLVSALSVALYGMFLAIIIPEAKQNRVVGIMILISFIANFVSSKLRLAKDISGGTQIIILTVLISSFAALVFPVSEEVN